MKRRFLLLPCALVPALVASTAVADNPPADAPTVMPKIVVSDSIRMDSEPQPGSYALNAGQIELSAQGPDSAFDRIMLRAPGVSQDSAGQVHFRQEDPYYRYYLNGVLLPAGINGFGQDIDTRLVDSVSLGVGALAAEYGQGNYGVASITTKSGTALRGSDLSLYGGSYGTLQPSLSYGGSSDGTDAYVIAGARHDDLGIENPTPGGRAVHDRTDQYHAFGIVSRLLSREERLSVIVSGSHSDFQIPNNPGQATLLEFRGRAKGFPAADSANLNETQDEQTYYAIAAYRKDAGDLSLQIAETNRYSSVLFRPDEDGDLYFDGVAGRVRRDILTNGLQADFTAAAASAHTIRGGLLLDTEGARADTSVAAFAADDDDVDPATGAIIVKAPPLTIVDDHSKRAYDGSLYAQDKWDASPRLTVNVGARLDAVRAYVSASQVSPRIGAVYRAADGAVFHAGYARYLVSPPLEDVSPSDVGKFDGTTNAADQDTDDPVKCERDHYFDAGVSREVLPGLEAGLDAYYKKASDQIDDGRFGAANIFSPYNFARARIYGAELSARYERGAFSAYGNCALSQAWARGIVSSQFEFDSDELAYIAAHDVRLDQTQFTTASAGIAYAWAGTTVHADALYGSGMRRGFANTAGLPRYCPVSLGFEHRWKFARSGGLSVRFDIVNLFDESYELNDGTGIGVGSPKYGARRGFYAGISRDL